ncbi:MAG TPA: TonB-dependent receptor [Acidobacteriota bacterium]
MADKSGKSVPAARVDFKPVHAALISTISDENGAFTLAVPDFMGGELRVSKEGFAPGIKHLSQADATQDLHFILDIASLSDAVIVTASRGTRAVSTFETPASVTVIGSDQVLTAPQRNIDDILRARVPGFSLFRRTSSAVANPTTQGVSLRATGGSGSSRTAVMDDGVPMTDPFGGWIYWSRLPRARVQSLEVQRGGSSDIYGSSAIGGVIGVETRALSAQTLVADLSRGNRDTGDLSLFASHTLGDAASGSWGFGLALDAATTEGYIPVARAERGRVDEAAGGWHRTGEVTLERRFGERGPWGSGARVFLRGQVFEEHRQNGTLLQRNSTASRLLVAGGETMDRYGDVWRARLYAGTQGYDQTFTSIALNRATESLTRLQRVPARQKGASLVWSRYFVNRIIGTAGFEARQVRGISDEIIYDAAGRQSSNTASGGSQESLGFFGSVDVVASQKFRISGGVRADTWRNYRAASASRALLPVPSPTFTRITQYPDRRENAFSPRVGIIVTPLERFQLRASVGRSFRAPTLNELYRDFRVGNILTTGNPDLKAERAGSGELGAFWTDRHSRVALRGTVFLIRLEDTVSNITLTTTPTLITRQRQNLGSTQSRGFEAEAEYRPREEWNFAFSYLRADAEVRHFSANTRLEGLAVPQIPGHSLTFEAGYKSRRFASVTFSGRYASEAFEDDLNSLKLGSFFVLDLRLARALNGWLEAYMAAENVFDREYAAGRTPIVTTGAPRGIRAGLNVRLPSP